MTGKIHPIALLAGALILFATGIFWGTRLAGTPGQSASGRQPVPEASATAGGRAATVTHEGAESPHPARSEILRQLRAARRLPSESRTPALLHALEQTVRLPLTPDLLDELRGIIEEGEPETSEHVICLLEEREDKDAVALLLAATRHADPEIADRALFGLEAIAGRTFENPRDAATWAADWQPDPDLARLFEGGLDESAEGGDGPILSDPQANPAQGSRLRRERVASGDADIPDGP